MASVESQKGVNAVQRCSVDNQKGAIGVQSLMVIAPFWFSKIHLGLLTRFSFQPTIRECDIYITTLVSTIILNVNKQYYLVDFRFTTKSRDLLVVHRQWRIRGGGGGGRNRRAPPLQLDRLWFFITHFVSECLKIGLR